MCPHVDLTYFNAYHTIGIVKKKNYEATLKRKAATKPRNRHSFPSRRRWATEDTDIVPLQNPMNSSRRLDVTELPDR